MAYGAPAPAPMGYGAPAPAPMGYGAPAPAVAFAWNPALIQTGYRRPNVAWTYKYGKGVPFQVLSLRFLLH